MGYVQIPDELKVLVDQHIADGHAASEADFITEAVRLYLGYLDDDRPIGAMVERADADMAAGRFVTLATPDDGEVVHRRTIERLSASLAGRASRD